MRVLILTLILLVPLSSNSVALTNELLYKWCKPFADRAFDAKTKEDLLCKLYIAGALEYAKNLCFVMEDPAKTDKTQAMTRSWFGASEDANIDALIQAYVNKMKNEPNNWDYRPNSELRQLFSELAPCK
jgi:hypothetical protein